MLDIYDEDWISNKNRSARNTSDFIKDRLVIIEEELGGIEEDLKDYKASHGIADISDAARQYLDLSKEYAGREFEVSNQLSIAKYIRVPGRPRPCPFPYPGQFRPGQRSGEHPDRRVQYPPA